MITTGLIVGVFAFFLVMGSTLISPLCAPCFAFLLGPISGYLTSLFEKPSDKTVAIKRGSYAGAIAGAGALFGQIGGAIINGLIVGPDGAARFASSFGLPTGSGFDVGYWGGLIGGTLCISIVNILIMAGTGALGGLLWWQTSGIKSAPPSQPL